MSKKTLKSRNTTQVFLIIITSILLITAILGIVNLFKKSNDNSAKDGSVEKTYEETIEELTNSLILLTDSNNEYKKQIESLNSTISENEVSIAVLNDVINNSTSAIASLNTEIEDKKNQIKELEDELAEMDENNSLLQTDINSKQNQIASLNSQVANLQTLVTQLQTTNDLNLKTIDTLNNQIQSLNSQISVLQSKINDNNNSTVDLNNKIASLEKSIEYYEQYIANLESETQVVATFEFDGSVYNIQILNKGAYASVVTPTSTDYVVFNYWTVDGEKVDLSTYPITTNTKFVANTTYKYDVKFMVDDTEYSSQIVTANNYATAPTAPTKTGYEFDGWSLNGIDIVDNIDTTVVTGNVTYTAVFTKLHTVTFVYESETKATQSVRNGNYANSVAVENTTYKVFNGWLLNGASVDISTYKIVADTVFVADITYKYDVKFMVDDTEYNSQIVTANNYATIPTAPTKDGYSFDGWSLNGTDIVTDIETIAVTGNTTYIAVFTRLHTVTFVYDDTILSTQIIRNGDCATIPANPTKDGYSFDGWSLNCTDIVSDINTTAVTNNTTYTALFTKLSGLYEKTWNGMKSITGSYVWKGGTNYYYSFGNYYYVLDKETSTWKSKYSIVTKSYNGAYVWTDGTNTYYSSGSDQYIFVIESSGWKVKTWNGLTTFVGSAVWTDGTNYYYSDDSYHYILDKETSTWKEKTWNGMTSFSGFYIWTDGTNIYYSSGDLQYVLDVETSTWKEKTWNGMTSFFGSYIWTDGTNIYYSKGDEQYILDVETSTWKEKIWNGFTSFYGNNVWFDGENYYYSSGSAQYIIYP